MQKYCWKGWKKNLALQIKDYEKKIIKNILKTQLPHARFLVFGSRATHQAKLYSDLDLAIDIGKPIPLTVLSKLEEQFAESDLVFKIDLIDFQRVSKEFQQRILKEYEEL